MSMTSEFKEFISRGNVIDLAVAVIIGAAFGAIVTSFVNDILGGALGALGGKPDFSQLTFRIGEGTVKYGSFLTAIVNFLIIALAVFLVVKAVNSMQARRRRGEEDELEEPTEIELLT